MVAFLEKSDKTDQSNKRIISLTSILGDIMALIIRSKLEDYSHDYNLIYRTGKLSYNVDLAFTVKETVCSKNSGLEFDDPSCHFRTKKTVENVFCRSPVQYFADEVVDIDVECRGLKTIDSNSDSSESSENSIETKTKSKETSLEESSNIKSKSKESSLEESSNMKNKSKESSLEESSNVKSQS
ncbi:secreted phosphoprotein 24-like, partial [Heptranchias perlo]|uniref:secreted phosphoprotein 24-like n=1 Tax=Heptranchias perlo TaxID=212740 RepID=UPI00355A341A